MWPCLMSNQLTHRQHGLLCDAILNFGKSSKIINSAWPENINKTHHILTDSFTWIKQFITSYIQALKDHLWKTSHLVLETAGVPSARRQYCIKLYMVLHCWRSRGESKNEEVEDSMKTGSVLHVLYYLTTEWSHKLCKQNPKIILFHSLLLKISFLRNLYWSRKWN